MQDIENILKQMGGNLSPEMLKQFTNQYKPAQGNVIIGNNNNVVGDSNYVRGN